MGPYLEAQLTWSTGLTSMGKPETPVHNDYGVMSARSACT